MKPLLVVLAVAIVALATFAIQRVAYASTVDCKGLKKWAYDTTYNKGADVYVHGSSADSKWECTAASCAKDFPDTVAGLKSWKDLGQCTARVE